MPFLGHHPYDGLDVSPASAASPDHPTSDPLHRARETVHRFAVDTDDESMLLDLLGLRVPDPV